MYLAAVRLVGSGIEATKGLSGDSGQIMGHIR